MRPLERLSLRIRVDFEVHEVHIVEKPFNLVCIPFDGIDMAGINKLRGLGKPEGAKMKPGSHVWESRDEG